MVQALGEAARELPWLSPCAASLIALVKNPTVGVWPEIRTDPGCVLHMIRFGLPDSSPGQCPTIISRFRVDRVLQAALAPLEAARHSAYSGFVDWNRPGLRTLLQRSRYLAQLSEFLAKRSRRCDPQHAWIAGLLAPLGWHIAAAIIPDKVDNLFQEFADIKVTSLDGSLDAAGLARRISALWRLPRWLSMVTGYLGMSGPFAAKLGGDAELFQIVQLAVALAEQHQLSVGLGFGEKPEHLISLLHFSSEEIGIGCEEVFTKEYAQLPTEYPEPHALLLLPNLISLAAENANLRAAVHCESQQETIDALYLAARNSQERSEDILLERKMTALAEFSAGAAHEINNPLAVISGQAQFLLARETEPNNRQALKKIVDQTKRIHSILTDVMQFARPPILKKQQLDADELIHDALRMVESLANDRSVQLVSPPPTGIQVFGNRDQLTKALTCLLRNAVEAAPENGWAAIRVEKTDSIQFIVDDNGRGPEVARPDLLFDPFYSGRQAGRGRGLGLPIAWRLARLHGGTVYWDNQPNQPTRFVLMLPTTPFTCNGQGHGMPEEFQIPDSLVG